LRLGPALLATLAVFPCACGDPAGEAPGKEAHADTGLVETDTGLRAPTDLDGDGVPLPADCNDEDPSIFPGATERCNGRDDNCDGAVDEGVTTRWYTDADGDGYGNPELAYDSCEGADGTTELGGDCDDTDPAIHPGAEDVCNGLDDDCSGTADDGPGDTIYEDADGDGYGDSALPGSGCPGSGWAAVGGDCDDGDARVSPGQPTDQCDGVDTDCDGQTDEDSKAGWSLMSVDTQSGEVYEIDPSTASCTVLSPVDTAVSINSMDVSENGNSIVHLGSITHIAVFDPCTGAWTDIGPHGGGNVGGIGFGPAGRLFGIGSSDLLYEFDLATGAATVIGPLGIDIGTSGLAWDCSTQTMYGADGTGDRVFEVDLATGAATNIRSTSVPFQSVGLEFDRVSGLLLASTKSALYTIDPTTGASSYVGPLGGSNIDDLAWHPSCP